MTKTNGVIWGSCEPNPKIRRIDAQILDARRRRKEAVMRLRELMA